MEKRKEEPFWWRVMFVAVGSAMAYLLSWRLEAAHGAMHPLRLPTIILAFVLPLNALLLLWVWRDSRRA